MNEVSGIREKARTLRSKGMSEAEIAKELGFSSVVKFRAAMSLEAKSRLDKRLER